MKRNLRLRPFFIAAPALLGIAYAVASSHQTAAPRKSSAFDDDRRIDAIFHRACANCHSNETEVPWYGRVGPGAWLIQRDIAIARAQLNFSKQLPSLATERQEVADAVALRAMPPKLYAFTHPEAKLSAEDLKALMAWAARGK